MKSIIGKLVEFQSQTAVLQGVVTEDNGTYVVINVGDGEFYIILQDDVVEI